MASNKVRMMAAVLAMSALSFAGNESLANMGVRAQMSESKLKHKASPAKKAKKKAERKARRVRRMSEGK